MLYWLPIKSFYFLLTAKILKYGILKAELNKGHLTIKLNTNLYNARLIINMYF